ncbi:excalibur calcium-binding domain-containing protein [Yoonia maritima]|uniref:Excalibur calcium-binding domain-containing protein n=1 Tax=Yoonia maritima TaxID=1435347 RepID=A0A2T0W0I9_9RHOB|nr:excalibur calcium-binding domain-containing protein [Yoonia maritima]
MLKHIPLIALTLAGCSPALMQPSQASSTFRASSQSGLCSAYISPSTPPVQKQMIEAELVIRGVRQCYGTNYGRSTAAGLGQSLYTRPSSPLQTTNTSQDLDCSNFSSGAEAQRYFLSIGGPISDPNDLDRDGDGLACEYGRQIRQAANYSAPRVSTYRPRSSSRCYTGPRGGTYTITSSGNKNYGGC